MITGRDFDIRALFGMVFNVAPPYPLAEVNLPNPVASFQAVAGTMKRVRGLKLGIPQFMPLSIDNIVLDIEPVVTVDGEKEIIRTRINGGKRKGTVKELFANGDWQVRIQGFIESEDGAFPAEEVQDIRRMFEKGQTLSIDSELLRSIGIQYMVIERVRFPEMSGVQGLQAFEISGYSDDYPERELTIA